MGGNRKESNAAPNANCMSFCFSKPFFESFSSTEQTKRGSVGAMDGVYVLSSQSTRIAGETENDESISNWLPVKTQRISNCVPRYLQNGHHTTPLPVRFDCKKNTKTHSCCSNLIYNTHHPLSIMHDVHRDFPMADEVYGSLFVLVFLVVFLTNVCMV